MDPETQKLLKERFDKLPTLVRDAITSADIQKQLRSVSDKHQLHIDQWGKLENEVMLTLLGFADVTKLSKNIQSEVGVSMTDAASLADDINVIVFEPIRAELERQLQHPDAQPVAETGVETARKEALAGEAPVTAPAVIAPAVQPGTPPTPKPDQKAIRAPISQAYTARQPSTERKDVAGDPYRELP